ncbi:Z-ring formation inhibitor MciZ [Bacillus sp. MRMR6]|nr:Z-ring formation inhibitor MciZ [Bacillus sp. MRMR6]OLS40163.1 hypothetical protein BTR25_10130 [Bacillus sp. MRMR6]
MKVYVHEKGIIISGKCWGVLRKLQEYNKQYATVTDWIQDVAKK